MTDTPPTETPTTPEAAPTKAPVPAAPTRRAASLVLVNTGDGKGKSTAAFGTMLRAVARGWPVAVVQFLKSGSWHVGEEDIGRRLGVDWWALGDGFTWDSESMEQTQAVALEAWRFARDTIAAGQHRMVILDEITYPINWGWIDGDEVAAAIVGRPADVNVIVTGRDAPAALIDIADTVTEMRKVRHAFDRGILAKKGVDY